MKFAVVELKYVKKKFFIVPIGWIKNYTTKAKLSSDGLFCYISTDLSEDPDFSAKYFKVFEGVSGMFKVFITKITNSLEAAVIYLKNSRLQSVPEKLRQAANTDSELFSEEKNRKRTENRLQKSNMETAHVKNTLHLAQLVKSHDSDTTERESDDANEKTNITLNVPSSSSTLNKKQNQSVVVIPNKKAKKTTLVGETIEPLKTQTASLATVTQSIVVIPNKKDKNPATAKKKNPSLSTSVYKNQNQSTVVIPTEKGNNSMFVGEGVQQVQNKSVSSGSTPNKIITLSSTVVNKINHDQATVHTEQLNRNSLLITKPFQSKVDDSCTAVSASFKVPQGVAPKPFLENKKRSANDFEAVFDKNVKSSSKKRKIVSTSEMPITKTSDSAPTTEVSEMPETETIKKLKSEITQLKMANQNLSERNTALQIALVTCTKAIPPPLSFIKKDGGRLYKCGIFLNDQQCKVLDAITDDQQFCNALIVAIFGSETLMNSSVKGMRSNRTGAAPRSPLNPIGLKFIYDTMAIRTNNSEVYNPYKINRIINKKISNLRASEQEQKPRAKKVQKTKAGQNIENDKETQEDIDSEVGHNDKEHEVDKEEDDNEEDDNEDDGNKEDGNEADDNEEDDNEENGNEENCNEDADNEEDDNEEDDIQENSEAEDREIIGNNYNEQEGSKEVGKNRQQYNEQEINSENTPADAINENVILQLDYENFNLNEYISPDNTFYIMDLPNELRDFDY